MRETRLAQWFRWWPTALCVLGLWWLDVPCAALAAPLQLTWNAPASCPDKVAIIAAILDLLPSSAPDTWDNPLGIDVAISENRDGSFAATLSVRAGDAVSRRTFSGATCASVARAAILIAALSIDGVYAASRVALPPRDARVRLVQMRLAGYLPVDLGSLPGVSGAAGAALAVQVSRIWLSAEGAYFLPRLALVSSGKGRGGQIGLITGALRACVPAWTRSDFTLGPCVGVELGQMKGTGTNLSHPRVARGLWGATSLGFAARHTAQSGLFVELDVAALAAFRRPIFVIDGVGDVFQSQRFAGRFALRVGFAFR